MIKKIANKVLLITILSSLLLGLLTAFLAVFFTHLNEKNTYTENALKTVNRTNWLFLDSVNNILRLIEPLSKNALISNYLEKEEILSGFHLSLMSLVNSYPIISNITLYSLSFPTVYTIPEGNGFKYYPPIETLKTNVLLNDFFNNSDKSFISVRKTEIALFYDFYRYDSELGIFSIIHKVTNQKTLGYIFIDLKPSAIETRYFDHTYNSSYKDIRSYLLDSNKNPLFQSERDSETDFKYLSLAKNNNYFLKDHNLVVTTNQNGFYITSIIPFSNVYQNLINSSLITLAVLVTSNLLIFLIAKHYTKKINHDLTSLKEKIKFKTN